jgi:hypothetical protein
MRLIYKPFGMLLGALSGLLAKRLFKAIWGRLDGREPPHASTEGTSWPRALGATALRALIFSLTRGAAERIGARCFQHLTGVWPGEKHPKKS